MNALKEIIFSALQTAGGTISFARFMELALYAPGCGYYEQRQTGPGRRGDYYTSVSVGPLFGQLLAARFAAWLSALGGDGRPVALAEAGAHDGQLAGDLLSALRSRVPAQGFQYWIIEPSPTRRAWQAERLQEFKDLVRWVEHPAQLPTPFHGILFANELLDAFPVHRLVWDAANRGWQELGVARESEALVWRRVPLTPGLPLPDVPEGLQSALPDGFAHDLCPSAAAWWTAAARQLRRGWLMTLDYGLEAADFLVPARAHGTLRGYREHRQVEDMLADPGRQDLTADVNFTALIQAGEAAGLTTEGLTAQAEFLVGIARDLQHDPAWAWTPAARRQFQTLVHPAHLGRRFRALVQRRA